MKKTNSTTNTIKKAANKAKSRFPGMASLRAEMQKADKSLTKAHKAMKKKRSSNG